jgi:hypothetical protein
MVTVTFFGFNILYVALVCAQNLGPFINPPERTSGAQPDPISNPVYAVGNTINITWTNISSPVALTIWQSVPDEPFQYLPFSSKAQLLFESTCKCSTYLASLSVSWFNWHPIGINGDNGQPSFDLSTSNIFHFDLFNVGATSPIAQSIWFNLTNQTINAQGSIISTSISIFSTSASTGTADNTRPTQLPSTPISSADSSPSPSSLSEHYGPTSSAKIGIGVGVSIGIVVLVASLAGVFLWRRGNKKVVPLDKGTSELKTGGVMSEMDGSIQPAEPVELPLER